MAGRARRRPRTVLALMAAAVALAAAACGSTPPPTPAPAPQATAAPSPTTAPPPPPPPCVAPPGGRQRDVDADDPPDVLWPRPRGGELVVAFAIDGLPRRYANAVILGARLWSRSPCVEATVVARCPPRGDCSTVVTRRSGGGKDVDGASESEERRGVRVGNAITLYTGLLDRSSDNGVLGTTVHEMGHALGLRHRNDPRSIMNATTGDRTDPRPDATDLANLAALYAPRDAGGRPR
jgi:Zn-dependent protease with chaperone function